MYRGSHIIFGDTPHFAMRKAKGSGRAADIYFCRHELTKLEVRSTADAARRNFGSQVPRIYRLHSRKCFAAALGGVISAVLATKVLLLSL